MNRLHIHISVSDIDRSIDFYTTLFGADPTVTKVDYAKWMLDDPSVNFAISKHAGATPGIDHIGIQAEDRAGLDAITSRLKAANQTTFDEEATTCCYAVSDKSWIADPSGVRWETFVTHGEATVYGADASLDAPSMNETPSAPATHACC